MRVRFKNAFDDVGNLFLKYFRAKLNKTKLTYLLQRPDAMWRVSSTTHRLRGSLEIHSTTLVIILVESKNL